MAPSHKIIAALPVLPLVGAAVIGGQVLYAARRTDLPAYRNQDPSGTFGDPARRRLRIVALGDSSLTAPGVVVLDNAWIRRTAILLSERYFVDLRSVAVGGARSADVLRRQLPRALALRPDIAVVSVGANDALRVPVLSGYEANLHEIVAALHRVAGAVVVSGVGDLSTAPRLPRALGALVRHRARRVDAAVARVTATYPRAVRIRAWGAISEAFRHGGSEMWCGDLFHASDTGHEAFVADVMSAMEEALALVGPAERD